MGWYEDNNIPRPKNVTNTSSSTSSRSSNSRFQTSSARAPKNSTRTQSSRNNSSSTSSRQSNNSNQNQQTQNITKTSGGYAYTDDYGFSHVVKSLDTAKKYAAGNIYNYDGDFKGGYAVDKDGKRIIVDTGNVREYGNVIRDKQAPSQRVNPGSIVSDRLQEIEQERSNSIVNTTPIKSNLTDGQKRAQEYINQNSKTYGTIDEYIARQQQRFDEARASGNYKLAADLISDSERVGFNLNYNQGQSTSNQNTQSGGVYNTEQAYVPQQSQEIQNLRNAYIDSQTKLANAQYTNNVMAIRQAEEEAIKAQNDLIKATEKTTSEQESSINQEVYDTIQEGKVLGQRRGVSSSQQQQGLEQGIKREGQSLRFKNQQDRTERLNSLNDRIALIRNQAEREITSAGSQRDIGIAQASSNLALKQMDQDFQREMSLSNQALQERLMRMGQEFTSSESALEREFRSDEATTAFEREIQKLNLGFEQQKEMLGLNQDFQREMQSMSFANQRAIAGMNASAARATMELKRKWDIADEQSRRDYNDSVRNAENLREERLINQEYARQQESESSKLFLDMLAQNPTLRENPGTFFGLGTKVDVTNAHEAFWDAAGFNNSQKSELKKIYIDPYTSADEINNASNVITKQAEDLLNRWSK